MKFRVYVNVMPHDELLDPQGKAILSGLRQLGMTGVEQVRMGKRVALTVEAENEGAAQALARLAAEKLLANRVVESFEVESPRPL
ncbi:MAG: phosphoribosylformylglycinamidine synthase subunit PurS [Bacteroidia bacterium]|nr:phosphoribosylformylglycinamidine synthase subunit PurS [Bacteroidia bacterium]